MLLVRHCQLTWLIGKTNLQVLSARVKALMSVCQFAALKLLSNNRTASRIAPVELASSGRCRRSADRPE
ncbi:Secreted protein [Pseudomonas sp. IT-P2]